MFGRPANRGSISVGIRIGFLLPIFCSNLLETIEAIEPIVLVHGGAGWIPPSRIDAKIRGVKQSAAIGYKILKEGGSVVDAVEEAVKFMELDEAFNAGYGSVLNLDGEVEMDASIMVGSNLSAGAVTVVRDIAHPISLARMVMERTPHVLLAGQGANKFAKEQGVPHLTPGALVSPYAKAALKDYKRYSGIDQTEIGTTESPETKNPGEVGTVGAVAIDSEGRLAAATSTGGRNGKMVGRSSDTSLIGSGTYADDFVGAVSTTGHGETIAKYCLAHSIINAIKSGKSAQSATEDTLKDMTQRLQNKAGAITISKTGEVGIAFNSKGMSWAYQKGNKMYFGIEPNDNNSENMQ